MADPPRPPRPLPPPGLGVGPCAPAPPSPPARGAKPPAKAPPKAQPAAGLPLPEDGRFKQLSEDERRSVAELAQIERAMAALQGRSAEGAEDMVLATLAAERRARALGEALERGEAAIAVRRRRLPLRVAGALVGVAALASGVVFAARWALAAREAREAATRALDLASAGLLASGFGFEEVASGLAGDEAKASVNRGSCYVAVAAGGATEPPRLRVVWRGQASEGRSVGFCACGPGEVLARGSAGASVRVLAAPSGPLGGPDLLAASLGASGPEIALAESVDRTCAEEAIDARLASGRADPLPLEIRNATEGLELALSEAGLRPSGRSAPGLGFVALRPGEGGERGTCWLARPRGAEARLSLRMSGGARPLGPLPPGSALVACLAGAAAKGASVWRDGDGEIAVFAAPSVRLGGTLGMLELSARAGLPARAYAPREALSSDAAAFLVASGLPAELPGDESAALAAEGAPAFAAFSADPESVPPSAPRSALCRPEPGERSIRGLCALGGSADREEVERALGAGHALARRPAWLVPAGGAERAAHLELLALSRRLSARGFELTTLVGASLTPGGAEIVGRSGAREIAAVIVSASPPFVHPLTDGAPWALSGEPRVVSLAAGKSTRLRASTPVGGGRREILVWRR